eukprot:m51a1_g5447 hypothetical protein (698) ;mRNA; f:201988-204740
MSDGADATPTPALAAMSARTISREAWLTITRERVAEPVILDDDDGDGDATSSQQSSPGPGSADERARQSAEEILHDAEEVDLSGAGLAGALSERACRALSPERLRRLFLAQNQLKLVAPTSLAHLAGLRSLSFSHNVLVELPPLASCVNLQHLIATENEIMLFPESLPPSLKVLDLSWNHISRIPPSVGSLTALERLSVWSNRISSLSPEIGRLRCLRTLWLDSNRITELPHEILSLPNLLDLHASHNPLSNLRVKTAASSPDDLGELRSVVRSEYERCCEKSSCVKVIVLDDYTKTTLAMSTTSIRGGSKGGRASRTLSVNFWELGGSPQYSGAHEWFMPKTGAVYMILYNLTAVQGSRTEYWLGLTARLSPECPVLLIGTYLADNSRINDKFLERHVESMLKEAQKTNPKAVRVCTVPLGGNTRTPHFSIIKDAIFQAAVSLPMINRPIHPLLGRATQQVAKLRYWLTYTGAVIREDLDISHEDLRLITSLLSRGGLLYHVDPPDVVSSQPVGGWGDAQQGQAPSAQGSRPSKIKPSASTLSINKLKDGMSRASAVSIKIEPPQHASGKAAADAPQKIRASTSSEHIRIEKQRSESKRSLRLDETDEEKKQRWTQEPSEWEKVLTRELRDYVVFKPTWLGQLVFRAVEVQNSRLSAEQRQAAEEQAASLPYDKQGPSQGLAGAVAAQIAQAVQSL